MAKYSNLCIEHMGIEGSDASVYKVTSPTKVLKEYLYHSDIARNNDNAFIAYTKATAFMEGVLYATKKGKKKKKNGNKTE